MNKISRHYTEEALQNATTETRIAVYEDQIRGWFHDQARILEKASDHCAFVLLMIAITYMEGHAIFLRGATSKSRSSEFFKVGFKAVFPRVDGDPQVPHEDNGLDEIYEQVRCGLFHRGFTRGKVVLSGDYEKPVTVYWHDSTNFVARIEINPHRLLDAVEAHLTTYVTKLRNPAETELRENFEKAWALT